MFSLIKSIKDYIISNGNVEEVEVDDCEPPITEPKLNNGTNTNIKIANVEAISEDEEKFSGEGEITCFDTLMEKGIIDGEYYFNKCDFENEPLKVKAKVRFTASKSISTGDQWIVRELKVLPSEKEKKIIELCKRRTIIGRAVINSKDLLEVYWSAPGKNDRAFSIPIPKNHPDIVQMDYKFHTGDYIRVELENELMNKLEHGHAQFGNGNILSISANKEKSHIGRITWECPEKVKFIVDGTISFTKFDVKIANYIPQPSDYVYCKSIETFPETNSNLSWRGVIVTKSDLLNYTSNSQDDEWIDHLNEEESYMSEALDDKNGIVVKPKIFKFSGQKIKTIKMKTVSVDNTSRQFYTLHSVKVSGDQTIAKFCVDFGNNTANSSFPHELPPGISITFRISCEPLYLGSTTGILNLNFGSFHIYRHITVTGLCQDAELLKDLRGSDRVVVRKWKNFDQKAALEDMVVDSSRRIVRGSQPVRVPFFVPNRIPTAPVPNYLRSILAREDEASFRAKFPCLDQAFTFSSYKAKFELSLWLEEIENDKLRRQYDLNDIIMYKAGECLKFTVIGIKDYEPPILAGDPICVFDCNNKESVKYEGHISEIRSDEVFVKFKKIFHDKYEQTVVKIQFRLGRTTYKRWHYAIDNAVNFLGKSWLFPTEIESIKLPRIPFYENESQELETLAYETEETSTTKEKGPKKNKSLNKHTSQGGLLRSKDRRAPSLHKPQNFIREERPINAVCLKWFNRNLNKEQKDAVRRILWGQARPLPYIIFGPPGTGKTITIVEAIMQVYALDPTSRILVTAPSNAAADIITERLVGSEIFNPGDLVRLLGFMRFDANTEGSSNIPATILPFCENGDKLDLVARHRLIISTLTTAGQFFQLGLDIDHFSHVFIDEAGYCTEPDAIIPCLLVTLGKGGQVIMAGDPNQLGPVIRNDSKANILSLSLLDRLMAFPLYSRNVEEFPEEKYNPSVLTKLVKNYRAHPLLLKIPSRLFYDDELESFADPEETQKLSNSLDFLPARGTPLLFHGVKGKEERDDDSPSCYNLQEVIEVCRYVKYLTNAGISVDDIGIITPYRKQVEKLRKAIPRYLLDFDESMMPKIGSVEEFQGGERNVTIISTVRSIYESKMDKVHERLEFIYSPKRFNVQITRAKSLLIIVGNPDVLAYNENWKQLLFYVIELKAYTGTNLPLSLDNVTKDLYKKASSAAHAHSNKEEDWDPANESSDDELN